MTGWSRTRRSARSFCGFDADPTSEARASSPSVPSIGAPAAGVARQSPLPGDLAVLDLEDEVVGRDEAAVVGDDDQGGLARLCSRRRIR